MDDNNDASAFVRLRDSGLLLASGAEARAFLHAQLTNDVQNLSADAARRAGWCSAKGRLLATFLVVPAGVDRFLLQLAGSLVAQAGKRLSMFVLRAKVKIEDVGAQWAQFGLIGPEGEAALVRAGLAAPAGVLACSHGAEGTIVVRAGARRWLVLAGVDAAEALVARLALPEAPVDRWRLEEVRDGLPGVVADTQDLFVPQMVNLELLGGVDFRKGCYPGQEVVARTQYRGQLKRRMVRARVTGGTGLAPGQDLYGEDGQPVGTVVNAVPAGEAVELLAVVPIAALESGAPLRVAPGGTALDLLPLPYAA